MNKEAMMTVAEICSMSISLLRGRFHREYIFDVIERAKATPAIVQHLAMPLNKLKEAAEEERLLAMKGEPSGIYDSLSKEADAREKARTALKAGMRAMMGMEDKQISTDAEKLFHLAHEYDMHVNDTIDGQTESIRNFIDDVETNYMDQMERIGMVPLFNILKAKNELVCDLRAQADQLKGNHVDGLMAEARKKTDTAYKRFVDAVNVFAYMQGSAEYIDLINYMNALIERYKRTHLNQTTSKPGTGSSEEIEEEVTEEETEETEEENKPTTTPPSEEQKPEGEKPSEGENGENNNNGSNGGNNTGNENNGNQQEEDDPNMPPPGSGGSGFE